MSVSGGDSMPDHEWWRNDPTTFLGESLHLYDEEHFSPVVRKDKERNAVHDILVNLCPFPERPRFSEMLQSRPDANYSFSGFSIVFYFLLLFQSILASVPFFFSRTVAAMNWDKVSVSTFDMDFIGIKHLFSPQNSGLNIKDTTCTMILTEM